MILNTEFYNNTAIARPEKKLNVASVLGKNVRMKRLTAESTAAKTGVTWGGQSVDEKGKVVGKEVWEGIGDGWVSMKASEAVILERGS